MGQEQRGPGALPRLHEGAPPDLPRRQRQRRRHREPPRRPAARQGGPRPLCARHGHGHREPLEGPDRSGHGRVGGPGPRAGRDPPRGGSGGGRDRGGPSGPGLGGSVRPLRQLPRGPARRAGEGLDPPRRGLQGAGPHHRPRCGPGAGPGPRSPPRRVPGRPPDGDASRIRAAAGDGPAGGERKDVRGGPELAGLPCGGSGHPAQHAALRSGGPGRGRLPAARRPAPPGALPRRTGERDPPGRHPSPGRSAGTAPDSFVRPLRRGRCQYGRGVRRPEPDPALPRGGQARPQVGRDHDRGGRRGSGARRQVRPEDRPPPPRRSGDHREPRPGRQPHRPRPG